MPINDNKVTVTSVPAGTTINGQTFASGGTFTVTPQTITNVAYTWPGDTLSKSKETSLNADKIIESLFRLNPKIDKEYEGDKQKFAAALIAAGEAAYQQKSLQVLRNLSLANDL